METQLLNITTKSLPIGFTRTIMQEVESSCLDSYTNCNLRFNNGQYGRPERDWLLGYERRALMEKRLRDAADSFGLQPTVESNLAGNHEFTQIRVGRLILTCSHKLGPDYFMLRASDFRDEHAKINSVLSQTLMPFVPEESRRDNGGFLNAVIFYKVHDKHKDKAEYLRLGFPSQTNVKWAHKFDFYDILEGYPTESKAQEDNETLIRWKRKLSIGVA
jgi:hypothetical protein